MKVREMQQTVVPMPIVGVNVPVQQTIDSVRPGLVPLVWDNPFAPQGVSESTVRDLQFGGAPPRS